MDKSEKILAAIEQLARNLTAKIDGVEAKLSGQIEGVRADVMVLQTDVADLKAGQSLILQHLDVAELKGRVEEQSRTIASLIATGVAAVGTR